MQPRILTSVVIIIREQPCTSLLHDLTAATCEVSTRPSPRANRPSASGTPRS